MDVVSSVIWLYPDPTETKEVLSPIFADPCSKKMTSADSSTRSPLTRDLDCLGSIKLQNGHVFTTCWQRPYFSRNVQVGRPLLELRGRHVVVLQVKVPQVALVRQLVDNVSESFTSCLLPKTRESSDRSRELPDASCSSVAVVISSWVTPFFRRFFS